jgi:hypothetical protein
MIISPLVYVSLLARDRAGVVPPSPPPPTRRLRRVRHLSPAPATQKANRDFLPHSLIGCGCGFPFPFPAGWIKVGALRHCDASTWSKLVCLVLYEISTQCPKSSYTAALPAADPKRCCSLLRLALSPKAHSYVAMLPDPSQPPRFPSLTPSRPSPFFLLSLILRNPFEDRTHFRL